MRSREEIGDMHRLVDPIVLGEHVTQEIQRQFDLARLAFIYSWFTYELATLLPTPVRFLQHGS